MMNMSHDMGNDNQNFLHEIEQLYGKDVRDEIRYRQIYHKIGRLMDGPLDAKDGGGDNPSVKINYTIWVLWLQGIEKAPRLIKKCHDALKANCPEEYQIILLNERNLYQYIQLPDDILEKYHQGCMTHTHFSDIVRMELLYHYGGCWIDATVYCSAPIPLYFLSGPIFFFKRRFSCSVIKGSSWWIYAEKGEPIIRETRRILLHYWHENSTLCEYFLVHIILSRVIDTYFDAREDYLQMPYFSNENPHYLAEQLGAEYDKERWDIIKEISKIHKLTYKARFLRGDIYNFYTALLENKLY